MINVDVIMEGVNKVIEETIEKMGDVGDRRNKEVTADMVVNATATEVNTAVV